MSRKSLTISIPFEYRNCDEALKLVTRVAVGILGAVDLCVIDEDLRHSGYVSGQATIKFTRLDNSRKDGVE